MLKKQFIAFLFASVLVANLGHNIVPHHHHIDNIFSHEGCYDHDAGKYAFHTGEPTSHCHAFNGIEYFPAPEKQSINKPIKTVKNIYLSHIIQLNQPIPRQMLIRPSTGSPPVICLLGSSTGLRAPPISS